MIPYRLTLEERPTYLHARVEGARTPENTLRFLREVYAAGVQRGRRDVLLEIRFAGPSLEISDIFHVISQASEDGAKLGRIAYVDATASDPARAQFAETVAINRAVRVRLFAEFAGAVRWLESGD